MNKHSVFPRPFASSAKYKLGLRLPADRAAAAEVLREARRFNRRCHWHKPSWARNLDIAAGFAVQEAEIADDDQAFKIYDHIAHVMENMVTLQHLRGG